MYLLKQLSRVAYPVFYDCISLIFNDNRKHPHFLFNPFVPNAPFLYPLKTSGNRKVLRCFQGVEKGYTGNKWANLLNCERSFTYVHNSSHSTFLLNYSFNGTPLYHLPYLSACPHNP